jgi:hypothetical protein
MDAMLLVCFVFTFRRYRSRQHKNFDDITTRYFVDFPPKMLTQKHGVVHTILTSYSPNIKILLKKRHNPQKFSLLEIFSASQSPTHQLKQKTSAREPSFERRRRQQPHLALSWRQQRRRPLEQVSLVRNSNVPSSKAVT